MSVNKMSQTTNSFLDVCYINSVLCIFVSLIAKCYENIHDIFNVYVCLCLAENIT